MRGSTLVTQTLLQLVSEVYGQSLYTPATSQSCRALGINWAC